MKLPTFGALHADLEGSNTSLAGIHSEDLGDVGADVVPDALTLAFDLGGIHHIVDRHREGASCRGKSHRDTRMAEELEEELCQ